MCAKPEQPEQRDRAIARLLAGALQAAASSPSASSAAGRAACPDAEILAAYADQGVSDSEKLELERHFAACGRCQETLAALGASLEAPIGESVAVFPAPASAVTPRPVSRPSQRWLWWLTPAFGAAAAALLWMVLRPAAPVPVQTAGDYSKLAEQKTDSLTAQANPSPSPEVAPKVAARRDAQSTEDKLTARDEPAAQAKQEAALDKVTALADAPSTEAAPAAPAARPAFAAAAAPPQASGAAPRVIVTDQLPPVNTTSSTLGGALPAEALPGPVARSATLGGNLSQETVAQLPLNGRNVAPLNLYSYTFASPDGSALWRLGVGGSIQRSTDRGQTWQQQVGGVTTDLVAGSAGSKDAAWVVGRAGVILRTTDGEHWQRIPAPDGATGDWVTVVVRSALSATVVAADLRRFSTEDGGRTWTLQQ